MNLWYGYKHVNGGYQAKRYSDRRDLDKCQESDFVEAYTRPFEANNRQHALEETEKRLK